MILRSAIEQEIVKLLPSRYHVDDFSSISRLANLLSLSISKQIPIEEAQEQLSSDPLISDIIQELSGAKITTANAKLEFGENNQIGDVAIRDLAGRDIFHLTINLVGEGLTQNEEALSFFQQLKELHQSTDGRKTNRSEHSDSNTGETQENLILIVDDDTYLASLYKEALREEAFEVITATNGIEGIRLAELYRPGLILLDMQMPQMGGYDVLSRIRKKSIRTRVIIITAFEHGSNIINACLRLGALDYILKPFNTKELLDLVRFTLAVEPTIDRFTNEPETVIESMLAKMARLIEKARERQERNQELLEKNLYLSNELETLLVHLIQEQEEKQNPAFLVEPKYYQQLALLYRKWGDSKREHDTLKRYRRLKYKSNPTFFDKRISELRKIERSKGS